MALLKWLVKIRYAAQQKSTELDISGWIKNLLDSVWK